MPVYNVEIKWLDKAIESIEKQNYKNWEICIADDCSTKQEVREHLSAMKNSRIKIKLLEKNQGISGATNAAAALASGEYILLMDNDDELAPSALHEFYQKIKKKVLRSYTAIWILLMRKEKREIHYVNLTGLRIFS